MKYIHLLLCLSLLLLSGCAGLPLSIASPTPQAVPTPTPTPAHTPGASPTPGPVTLRIWLPPQFDPAADSPAGDLLQARLDEFKARRPNVRLDVRVKAMDGPGGLLDSLTTASAAAPLALPDLVALPRPDLEAAALKGLLHSYDPFTKTMDGADWYDYARQLGRLQNSTFGLPFAGDALLLAYRSNEIPTPPHDLATALQTPGPLVFPAADPQALFTLALYQAEGGPILDEQGRPFLDSSVLMKVLTFYQEAGSSELLPFWLTQFQNDEQAWEAFETNQADLAVTWASRYLSSMLADTAAAPIPTPSGSPFTLATGWVWALASATPERQVLSVELAEFLTESGFLAEWTAAAGFLPTRPDSLSTWRDPALRSLAATIVESARLYPSADVLTSIAPLLEQATLEVLKQQSDPMTASEEAVKGLARP